MKAFDRDNQGRDELLREEQIEPDPTLVGPNWMIKMPSEWVYRVRMRSVGRSPSVMNGGLLGSSRRSPFSTSVAPAQGSAGEPLPTSSTARHSSASCPRGHV